MRNPNKNRSMDHNNLSFKAILMKYRCPFVPSLFQKRPSCFPKRCLLLDSQRVNENARVIRRSLPMSLFGPCPTSSVQKLNSTAHHMITCTQYSVIVPTSLYGSFYHIRTFYNDWRMRTRILNIFFIIIYVT